MPGLFSNRWNDYSFLRGKYSEAVPVPQASYFHPIRSIDDLSTLAIRPIEKPLWLLVNTLAFLIKAIIDLVLAIILAPCALILALVAPNSKLRNETCSSFQHFAASTCVDVGMAGIALFATAISLLFNPLHVITRAAATVVDAANKVTEGCCGLTIARL